MSRKPISRISERRGVGAGTLTSANRPLVIIARRPINEELMSDYRVRSRRRFSVGAIALLASAAALVPPATAADSGSPIPDLFGQWGRDMLFFEPPPSGPGPVVRVVRKADGTVALQDPCCTIMSRWL